MSPSSVTETCSSGMARGRGIGAVGDLLTGAERRQDQLDRVRPRVGAAQALRLVHHEAVVPQCHLGAEALAEGRNRFEGCQCLRRVGTEGLLRFDDQGAQLVAHGVSPSSGRLGSRRSCGC